MPRGATFGTARRDWYRWSSILWGPLWFLPRSCWSRWQNSNSFWTRRWLFEVIFKRSFIFNKIIVLIKILHYTIVCSFIYVEWCCCRRSFGSVLDIIPLADSVTKLTARCELCGKRAFFTLRKTQETQTELIGGADVYMPVCRQHYVSGQVVIEAARVALESQVHCGSYA